MAYIHRQTRNWLQARLSVYPPQNYLRLITSFKSNMQNICQKYLFSIIILHENPPYVVVTAKLISAFVFATRIVQFLFYLNPKFEAYSLLLLPYRSVCVGPVQKPHCWFSHEAAHIVGFPTRWLIFEDQAEPTLSEYSL